MAAAGERRSVVLRAVAGSGKRKILGWTKNAHAPPGVEHEKVVVTTDDGLLEEAGTAALTAQDAEIGSVPSRGAPIDGGGLDELDRLDALDRARAS